MKLHKQDDNLKDLYDQHTQETIADMHAHADDLRAYYHRKDRKAMWRLMRAGWLEGDRAAERAKASFGWKMYVLPPLLSAIWFGLRIFVGEPWAWAFIGIVVVIWLCTLRRHLRLAFEKRREIRQELDGILYYRSGSAQDQPRSADFNNLGNKT
jgi:hypothetical protein